MDALWVAKGQRFQFRRKTKTLTRLFVCTHARIQKVRQRGSKFFFLVDEGIEDPNTAINGPS